jgi:hypothetical protein
MISLTLWYSSDEIDHDQTDGDIVRTHEQLDRALDRVAALSRENWPVLAQITQTDDLRGPMLYAGFHVDQGAILFPNRAAGGRFYTVGVGMPDGEPLLYMYDTSDNEFPPNSEISAELIRQAVHEFADSGGQPTCVDWQLWRAPVTPGSET